MTKKNILFSVFILIGISSWDAQAQSGRADDCSKIDIRDSLNPVMREHFSKPHNQGYGGLCYAFSSSDIVGAAVGAPVSPVHLALNHGNSLSSVSRGIRKLFDDPDQDKIPSGGYPSHAIRELQKRVGYGCGLGKQSANFVQEAAPFSFTIEGMTFEVKRTYSLNKFVEDVEGIWYRGCGDCQLSLLDGLPVLFPGSDVRSVYDYVLSQKGKDILKVAYQLYDAHCAGKYSLAHFKVKTWEVGGNPAGSLMRKVDEQLQKGRPLSLLFTAKPISTFIKTPFALHVSTIIGRQKLNNQCYYLLRGTEGARCDHRKPQLPCNAKEGTYLVPQDTLRNMATSVTWIE